MADSSIGHLSGEVLVSIDEQDVPATEFLPRGFGEIGRAIYLTKIVNF
jgi:hypothetical protein